MSKVLTTSETADLRNSCADRFNLSLDAKSFTCKFIEPGLVNYRDQGGGLELLRKETLDRCMETAIGNPLTNGHVMVHAGNRMEVEEGIVSSWYYNSADGWYYTKGTADTVRAQRLIPLKKPSCGYQVTSWGPGGVYHGIRYDKEITGLRFNHLAIVDKPRYEEATFRFNSMNLFKVIYNLLVRTNGADGKSSTAVEPQALEIPGDALVQIGDKQVRMNDLGQLWMSQTDAAVKATPVGDMTVQCGDFGTMRVNELVEKYVELRKNADAAEAEKKKTEDKKKSDAEAFARLNAARTTPPAAAAQVPHNSGSLDDRVATAKARGY